uniref:Uncharacterized protein n=1 Tax=Plectus sambesii TaxID=2011161 RepID=A0A914XDP6_9BILA
MNASAREGRAECGCRISGRPANEGFGRTRRFVATGRGRRRAAPTFSRVHTRVMDAAETECPFLSLASVAESCFLPPPTPRRLILNTMSSK